MAQPLSSTAQSLVRATVESLANAPEFRKALEVQVGQDVFTKAADGKEAIAIGSIITLLTAILPIVLQLFSGGAISWENLLLLLQNLATAFGQDVKAGPQVSINNPPPTP